MLSRGAILLMSADSGSVAKAFDAERLARALSSLRITWG
jgi:hypothetical protein